MKKIKKLIITAVTGITILNAFSVPASASSVNSVAYNNTDDSCVPYADDIQTKWRLYNKVLQYRRWNATKNRWVDPDWINYYK